MTRKAVEKPGNDSVPENDSVMVYVASRSIETLPKTRVDESGQSVVTQYVVGSINGEPFEVPCDRPVAVSVEVAAVLEPILSRQLAQ